MATRILYGLIIFAVIGLAFLYPMVHVLLLFMLLNLGNHEILQASKGSYNKFHIYFGCSWFAASYLYTVNYNLHIIIIVIAFVTDTFAFYTGKYFQGYKMCIDISPNKTWSGFILGSILGGMICYEMNIALGILPVLQWYYFLVFAIISQLSDLVASRFKRAYSVKDFGDTIPGHGGVLDRFDSMMLPFIIAALLHKLSI